jgi:hypothetical protein
MQLLKGKTREGNLKKWHTRSFSLCIFLSSMCQNQELIFQRLHL